MPDEKGNRTGSKDIELDKYLVFDRNRNEIRMEIPVDIVMNPDTNKKLRDKIKNWE